MFKPTVFNHIKPLRNLELSKAISKSRQSSLTVT